MTMELNLQIAGALTIALGLAHPFFDRYLGWSVDTQKLTLLTRQVFRVHCFFIALVLVLTGALSMMDAPELLARAPLSRAILAGLALFWTCRMAAQWFVYDARIWRGSRLFTVMHWAFSALWTYFAGSYAVALLRT
jgi:hypothetical protein